MPIAVGSRQSGRDNEATKTHQIRLRIDQQQVSNSAMEEDLMGMSNVLKDEKPSEDAKAPKET